MAEAVGRYFMQQRSDDIIGKVRHALALEPRVDAPRITITMIGPELALSGVLDSPEAVRVAGDVAREAAPGVPIDNGLAVAEGRHGRTRGDLAKRAVEAFEAALERLGGRPARGGVEVTAQGEARLHGSCSTTADRRALIEAVGEVEGLREVDPSDLRVAHFGTADDIRLGNLAEEALMLLGPELPGAVKVDVRDRVAHVRGSVREEQDRRQAIAAIEAVPGIARIVDRLGTYHAGVHASPEVVLEQRIKQALSSAGLPVPNIAVFVAAGVANLVGEVETEDQRRLAIATARKVQGVAQVDSGLTIVARHGRATRAPNDGIRNPRGS
jgi:osmotically-inducible protein OsmY